MAGAEQQARIATKGASHLSVPAKARLLLHQYRRMLAVDLTSTAKHAKEVHSAIVVVSTDTVEIAPHTALRAASLALGPASRRPVGAAQSASRAHHLRA
jgi:hypothetical protein